MVKHILELNILAAKIQNIPRFLSLHSTNVNPITKNMMTQDMQTIYLQYKYLINSILHKMQINPFSIEFYPFTRLFLLYWTSGEYFRRGKLHLSEMSVTGAGITITTLRMVLIALRA